MTLYSLFFNVTGTTQTNTCGHSLYAHEGSSIEDGWAAVQCERILEGVQARTGVRVAAFDDPAVGLQQHCRTEVAVAVPPVARATGSAARAQDAFVEAVELGPVLLRLQALAVRRWRALGADPRLDRSVLGVEIGRAHV